MCASSGFYRFFYTRGIEPHPIWFALGQQTENASWKEKVGEWDGKCAPKSENELCDKFAASCNWIESSTTIVPRVGGTN
jgi:hypothetical protein